MLFKCTSYFQVPVVNADYYLISACLSSNSFSPYGFCLFLKLKCHCRISLLIQTREMPKSEITPTFFRKKGCLEGPEKWKIKLSFLGSTSWKAWKSTMRKWFFFNRLKHGILFGWGIASEPTLNHDLLITKSNDKLQR